MKTATVDEQINIYLGELNLKEKAVVLRLVKAFVESRHDSPREGKVITKEIAHRSSKPKGVQ